MTKADTAKGGAKAPKRKGAKKAAKKAVEGAPKGTEGPMPMADTAKDGAKAPKRKGAKKAAKKAVEGAPKGETVQNQPQAADTKPGSKASTDPKKSEEPKRVYTPEDDARTVMVFGCSPKVTKEAVRARWPSAEVVHFLMRSNRHTGTVSVLFTTTADALAAAKDGTVEIAGEKLRVAMHETPEQKAKRLEQRQRSVSVSSLPSGVTEADVLQAFPGAEAVILHKNKQKGEANGWATVTLRTAEAAAGAARVQVEVKGVKVTPFTCGLRPPATESSKKRKAAELSPTAQPSTATAEPGEASKPAKKKLKKAASN